MNNQKKGLITKVISGFYYVEVADVIYECKARGSVIKGENEPVPGDIAVIEVTGEQTASLEFIEERKNFIVRPSVANLDQLFIIVSTCQPSPNYVVLDKIIAIAEYNDIEPIIIITKTDLRSDEDLLNNYTKAGFLCYIVSPEERESLEVIQKLLCGKLSVFTGNSGAGKSTVLNALYPEMCRETGDISQKLGRGRHTTRHVELLKVEGNGYVADTPGFSTMDIVKYQLVDKEQLQYCFREFKDYIDSCRFTMCSHITEPNCKVIEAVENKKISENRHKSYATMYNEIKNIKKWELKK